MKVLHIGYSDKLGGAAIAMIRLHQSLKKKNIDSKVLVGEKLTKDDDVFGPKTNFEKKINEFKIKLARQKKYFYNHNGKYSHSLNLIRSNIISRINSIKPDIINLHWINNELISIKEISKLKKPIIWTFNDMWPMCGGEHYSEDNRSKYGYDKTIKRSDESGIDLNKYLWKLKQKYWKSKINHVICISNWLKLKAEQSSLFKNSSISYIPCTINLNEWTPVNRNLAREKLNLPKDKLILLFMSTNGVKDKRKGFKYVKYFLDNMPKTNKDIILLNIGKDKNNIFKSDKILNIDQSFNGDPSILKFYYSASNVLLAPSILEAFGQVAIEAAACGVPTIGFKETGLEDAIFHKKTGYVCEHLDQKDFDQGLNWILEKIEKNEDYFKIPCFNYVKNNFSSEIVSKKYLDVYERVLNNDL